MTPSIWRKSLRFPSRAAQGSSRHRPGQFAFFVLKLSIHEHILYPFRKQSRALVGCFVDDGCGVEDSDIGKKSLFQKATVLQALTLSWKRCKFPDCLFQRKQMFLAHIMTKQTWHAAKCARMPMGVKQRPIE